MQDISRSEGNHRMKFSQLIGDKMKDIFLEKSYRKCGGETSPRPKFKKSKLSISVGQQVKFHTVCCYCAPKTTKICWN